MGTQQLLLVVLGMVLVGLGIIIGVTLFHSNGIESNRSAVINDLMYMAGRAQDYYARPQSVNGGNHSFNGVTMHTISTMTENANGHYYLESVAADEVVLIGVGNLVADDDTVRVRLHVKEKTTSLEIIH